MICPSPRVDMNGDGVITITDIWQLLSSIYHWPGTAIIDLAANSPRMVLFFELSTSSCISWWVTGVSTMCWLTLFSIVQALDR